MSIKAIMAYVKILISGVFFLLVIMLFFSNAGNRCSNLQFFTKTFNDVSLAKLMLTCAGVGAAGVFMVWMLISGSRSLYRYRKEHPVIRPSQAAQQPCSCENENLSENE